MPFIVVVPVTVVVIFPSTSSLPAATLIDPAEKLPRLKFVVPLTKENSPPTASVAAALLTIKLLVPFSV